MLVRGLGYTSLAAGAGSYGVPFTDVTVNKGFITVAYDLGIMSGKGGARFEPDAPATREQAAAVPHAAGHQPQRRPGHILPGVLHPPQSGIQLRQRWRPCWPTMRWPRPAKLSGPTMT